MPRLFNSAASPHALLLKASLTAKHDCKFSTFLRRVLCRIQKLEESNSHFDGKVLLFSHRTLNKSLKLIKS